MAWAYPKRWVVGEALTSADLNANVTTPLRWVGEDAPACKVYRTSTTTITSGSFQAVPFTAEVYDPAGMHSNVSNTSRITISDLGVYYVKGNVRFSGNTSGNRVLRIRANGTTNLAECSSPTSIDSGHPAGVEVSTLAVFRSTGYLELMAFQDSGSTLNTTTNGESAPSFEAVWMRDVT